MIVGVKKVVCTCGKEMERTGGVFGDGTPTIDTYLCFDCGNAVNVVTLSQEESNRLTKEIRDGH